MGRFLALRGGNLLPNLPPSTGQGQSYPRTPLGKTKAPSLAVYAYWSLYDSPMTTQFDLAQSCCAFLISCSAFILIVNRWQVLAASLL